MGFVYRCSCAFCDFHHRWVEISNPVELEIFVVESFFEKKSLIIVPIKTSSGGDYYKITSYKIKNNELILNVKLISKGVTCDLGEKFMILEIRTEKIANIDKISCNIEK